VTQKALESPEKEVARAAGGVDELEALEPVLLDSLCESAIENELLDEDRSLEECVLLLSVHGEVLVEVTEEAGIEVGVGEVVDQVAVGVLCPPESEQS